MIFINYTIEITRNNYIYILRDWRIHGVKIRVIISLIKDELKSLGFKYVFGRKFYVKNFYSW